MLKKLQAYRSDTDVEPSESDILEQALLSAGIILFFEEITPKTGNSLLRKLLFAQLCLRDMDEPEREQAAIKVFLSSPGGDENVMFALTDAIESFAYPHALYCFALGQVASAAVWVLASFPKGHRIAYPSTQFLIHEGFIALAGKRSDVHGFTKETMRRNKLCIEQLARWTGRSTKTIKRLVSKETFLDAEQAKRLGLIDEIVDPYADTD